MPNYTKIEDLMDIEEFFDDRGKGPHSMNGMPPQKFNNLQQQVLDENSERHSKIKPLEGKLRSNVNMSRAMNGGSMSMNMPMNMSMNMPMNMPMNMSMNSGTLYPSNPMMHSPAEMTNPDFNDGIDASNYRLGPKAYAARRPGNNSYSELVEGYSGHNNRDFNCIDVSNHIKSCPICSKFYENDKSMYVIIIIILVIICIILARKVLENYEK